MRQQRQTSLASQAFEYADKVQASAAPLKVVKDRLSQLGEAYADGVDQCEQIDKAFHDLADKLIDLGVLIIKGDRAAHQEPATEDTAGTVPVGERLIPGNAPVQPKQSSDDTSGEDRPPVRGTSPHSRSPQTT